MLDYNQEIEDALSLTLPTYYEAFVDSTTEVPCYTYIESASYAQEESEVLWYSTIGFTIKVWAKSKAEIEQYAHAADKIMRGLRFKRTSSYDLAANDMIEKIMTYEALAVETPDILPL